MLTCNPETLFSANARSLKPSAIREICKLIEAPDMKSLAGGWPDPAIFPVREISNIVVKLLASKADRLLQYGTTEGHLELRRELSKMTLETDGIRCTPDQILITAGSAQGMDLVCRTLINPGDIVLVGLPTYFGGTSTISAYGGQNSGIPVDEEGLQVEVVAEKLETFHRAHKTVKAVYVIPNFQNPTGITLTLERRKRLLELADQYNFMVIEDDPYGELRFEGQNPPSLMALDEKGYVVHLRSTSKIFSPGMRVAWVAGQTDVIRKMAVAKQFADVATNTLSQYILLEFIKNGDLAKEIIKIRGHYRRKRDLMLGLLHEHFPGQTSWTRPSGGFFIFVTLPHGLNAGELLNCALHNKVAFVTGSSFFIDGSGQNTFRLSYSQASSEDIEAAIPSLGALIKTA